MLNLTSEAIDMIEIFEFTKTKVSPYDSLV